MSDGDGMDSYTQVPYARCVWAPVAMSYHARYYISPLPVISAPVKPTGY
jgi:hypothetical protein